MNMIARVEATSKAMREGWVRLGKAAAKYWHYQLVDGTVKCMAARGPQVAIQVIEWRSEPSGRYEVCPVCRKYVQECEREQKAYEKAKKKLVRTPVPEREPEVLLVKPELVETARMVIKTTSSPAMFTPVGQKPIKAKKRGAPAVREDLRAIRIMLEAVLKELGVKVDL